MGQQRMCPKYETCSEAKSDCIYTMECGLRTDKYGVEVF